MDRQREAIAQTYGARLILRFGSTVSGKTHPRSDVDEVLVERYPERIVGRMIDVNYHVLIESGHPPPTDYYQLSTQLARLGVLPLDFATQIAACAGLRNRLVHEYDDIDAARVYEAAGAAVRNVPEYARHVQRFVEQRA